MTQSISHPEVFIASDGERYSVSETIATGGYSIIYKAVQDSTQQDVAIKVLKFNEPDYPKLKSYFIACFTQEIRMCSGLSHPNIIKLVNHGYLKPDEPFAVYEFIAGTTLDDFIFQFGALTGPETKYIMLQVLEALTYLHEKGIVHSDLKPQNIMLSKVKEAIRATILDLGSSIEINDQAKPDSISTLFNLHVLATANYCSPEQLSGTLAGFKSDIYAWGLILLECMTGTPAIKGHTIATVLKNQMNDLSVPIPASITEPALIDLLSKVLQKKQDNRLGDIATIREMLNGITFGIQNSKADGSNKATGALESKATGIRRIDIKAASDPPSGG